MLRRPLLVLSLALLALTRTGLSADRRSLVSSGDAFIIQAPDARSWTIGTSDVRLTIALTRRGLQVTDLSSPHVGWWNIGSDPDTQISLGAGPMTLGSRWLVFEAAEASEYQGGVRLDLAFRSASPAARVTRTYVSYPRTPVVETWTTFEPLGSASLVVADLNAFESAVYPGIIRWVPGHNVPASEGGPFTLMSRSLEPGSEMSLGSTGRATERALPWFVIDAHGGRSFGGLVWSGAWEARFSRTDSAIRVRLGLPPFATMADSALETPHGFFGVTGESADVSAAVQSFTMHAIRRGRAFEPLVAYNTWFAHGTRIDQETVLEEIDLAATLGIELFVLDAGWYGSNPDDPFDFTPGLGLWDFDPERFPHGLRALRDYAHDRGLRFGIWVEPERVALATVDRPYLAKQRWLPSRAHLRAQDPQLGTYRPRPTKNGSEV